MIEKYLTEDRIALNLEVSDWKDLVDKVGELMINVGDIEIGYVEAMKQVVEEMGPYAVIAPGVVLLHARPEAGVKRISFVMATLKNPVNFGSVNDPVWLATGLGALDHHGHVELLRDLSNFLQDKERLNQLSKAKDKNDFIRIVKGG